MTITIAQSPVLVTEGIGGSFTSQTATYGSSVTAGNLLVCAISAGQNSGTQADPVLTDTLGNSWSIASKQYDTTGATNPGAQWIFFATTNSSGANTVTITMSASGGQNFIAATIYEFTSSLGSVAWFVDGSGGATSASTVTATCTVAPSVAVGVTSNWSSQPTGAASGWTFTSNPSIFTGSAYSILTSTGSYAPGFTPNTTSSDASVTTANIYPVQVLSVSLTATATLMSSSLGTYQIYGPPATAFQPNAFQDNAFQIFGGAPSGHSCWTILNSTSKQSVGTLIATTPSIDTTGATLIIIGGGSFDSGATFTDSQSNTWTQAILFNSGSPTVTVAVFYCENPITSTSHTFSMESDATFAYNSFAVVAVSGGGPLDQLNYTIYGSGSTNEPPGSITPSVNDELLLVFNLAYDSSPAYTLSIDSGFTAVPNTFLEADSGSGPFGIAAFSLIQPTSASVNPIVTRSAASGVGGDWTAIVSFKCSGGVAALFASAFTAVQARAAAVGSVGLKAVSVTQAKSFTGVKTIVRLLTRAIAQAKAFVSPIGKAPLTAKSNTQAKLLASPSGKLGLAAHAETIAKVLAGIGTGSHAALVAIAGLMAKALAAPIGKAAMSAAMSTEAKVSAAPSGKVGIVARTAAVAKALAGVGTGGFAQLAAYVAIAAKAALGTPKLPTSLSARTTAQVKASPLPSGKVSLAAKSVAIVKTLAGMGTGGFAHLVSIVTLATKAAFGTGSYKLPMTARAEAMGSASVSPAAKVGLAARTVLQARQRASAVYTALLSAIATTAAKAKLGNPLGRVALAALTTMQTKAVHGFLAGFNIPIALFAKSSFAVKSGASVLLSYLPVAERTLSVAAKRTLSIVSDNTLSVTAKRTIAVASDTTIKVANRVRTLIAKW